eukprot:superscaffoldBa00010351_g24662
MAALPLLLLALWTCGDAKSAFPLRPSYSLYAGGHTHSHGARAASRHSVHSKRCIAARFRLIMAAGDNLLPL